MKPLNTNLLKSLSLSIAMLFASQANTKNIEQYNSTSLHNIKQPEKELFINLDSSSIQKDEMTYSIDTVLNPSEHINIIHHDNIITITIDDLYTKQFGITGDYICNLIQDNNDKNYYILSSNIYTL